MAKYLHNIVPVHITDVLWRNNTVIMGDFNYLGICWKNSAKIMRSSTFLSGLDVSFIFRKVEEDMRESALLIRILINREELIEVIKSSRTLKGCICVTFSKIWQNGKLEYLVTMNCFKSPWIDQLQLQSFEGPFGCQFATFFCDVWEIREEWKMF